jgi:hypothetical protein
MRLPAVVRVVADVVGETGFVTLAVVASIAIAVE